MCVNLVTTKSKCKMPLPFLYFGKESKQLIERLTSEVKSAKQLYAQTMQSLEAISNRIHESRRLGHWLNSPPASSSSRCRGVGAEGIEETSPVMKDASASSLPSSPRHTPPGQADTDSELAELDLTAAGKSTFFASTTTPTSITSKSVRNPLFSGVSVQIQLYCSSNNSN